MKILVTGSSGTIGTRLCEKLVDKHYEVVGADWVPNKWNSSINDITVDIDLRDISQISKLPSDIDLVVHLAANARVYELVEHPERACDNFVSTFNTLEYARQNGVPRFMFASSRESYGNIPADSYTEDMVRVENCESPYTASKVGGEALVHSYGACYDMDYILYRFSNVYGMYDDSVRVVPEFIRLAKNNETLHVFGKDKELDFTYIDDCVAGIIAGIEKFDTAKNDTYNIAFGSGTTLITLAESVINLLESSSEIQLGDVRTGEVVRYIANVSKAEEKLGYSPQYSFAEGIAKAVEWYNQNT